jgi:hypothetical protein
MVVVAVAAGAIEGVSLLKLKDNTNPSAQVVCAARFAVCNPVNPPLRGIATAISS